ncbi:terminase small subunit, partial [Patescibacteria group bacterium]|nr:terminase small subunit [Patescibacteria group bacterium]
MDGTKEKKLTNKDKLFVQEYLIDLDVERAALT